jgi:hypothetical protein
MVFGLRHLRRPEEGRRVRHHHPRQRSDPGVHHLVMVEQGNRMKREAPPAAPTAPPEDVVLLPEIRGSPKGGK